MHELSIAHAVVGTVSAALPAGATATRVRLRIGELSGVVPQALLFAYDVAADGTPLAGSELVIETAPIVIDCQRCGRSQLPDARDFRCPTCGEACGNVVGGKELEILDVTLADADDRDPPAADPADAAAATAEPADADAAAGTATADAARTEQIRAGVLAKNDLLAEGLRRRFTDGGVRVSNWVSSPGSGKTALLEAMLALAVERGLAAAALVGDCATDNDAVRLARSGAAVRQIVTDGNCHLESQMISEHLEGWEVPEFDLLVIENVGNLVCPASYDLGEDTRVALLSVTEGEDKPLKYPKMFHTADIIVLTKTDIAEPVGWDRDAALAAIASVNPDALVLETSARRGDGVAALLDLLTAPAGGAADHLDQSRLQEAP